MQRWQQLDRNVGAVAVAPLFAISLAAAVATAFAAALVAAFALAFAVALADEVAAAARQRLSNVCIILR